MSEMLLFFQPSAFDESDMENARRWRGMLLRVAFYICSFIIY